MLHPLTTRPSPAQPSPAQPGPAQPSSGPFAQAATFVRLTAPPLPLLLGTAVLCTAGGRLLVSMFSCSSSSPAFCEGTPCTRVAFSTPASRTESSQADPHLNPQGARCILQLPSKERQGEGRRRAASHAAAACTANCYLRLPAAGCCKEALQAACASEASPGWP